MRSRLLETGKTARKSRTSHAQVVDELGRAIVAGNFPVGSILPGDAELAQRFKVSRTVLRETMKTLAAKGMIVAKARVGTRVTEKNLWNMFDSEIIAWHFDSGVTEEFLLQLYDIRLAFEPFAAGLVAERASKQDVENLRTLATEMAALGHTSESLALADLHFHLAIAEASHNPFMRTLGSLIEAALVGMFRISTPPSQNGFSDIADTHMRIVDAIVAGNVDAARRAMEVVIIDGRDHVREAYAAMGKVTA
ncbi:DNA-binding FadR family transcriptional regulator [Rhizobium sp. BK181]|uniref:FadR/GntR family transcriptional regulator n=1 Tax=Rhizobium sp. BK181 TaxID=2587072 RepID=UPI00160C088E|nr:FadR/GntR family transcriptional regulator [Rhizobium sp. BK181]MBB3318973.1 DNA-binding FadR family transcriptional regulator [Rhizobium sp. BK181]